MDNLHPSRANMLLPLPQVKMPQLQRETACIQPEKVDPHSARNLLRKIFKKSSERLPTAKNLQAEHVNFLLDTPIGRDFNLITAAGVEFQVHSVMFIGGSKALQEGLFPGGVINPDPPSFVNLPPHFHPILVDRFVKFIYTSDYSFLGDSRKQLTHQNFRFYHATVIPDARPPNAATTGLVGIRDYAFHLHMYALGEELDYDALKTAAHAKLAQTLVNAHSETPSAIHDAIDATFSPSDSPARICKDDDRSLQQLVVAAALAHELKEWNETDQKLFVEGIQGPEYAAFRNAYEIVKDANGDLIQIGDAARSLAAEHKMRQERWLADKKSRTSKEDKSKIFGSSGSPMGALGTRIKAPKDKFKKRYEEKRSVGAAAKAGGDEDMDMEVD